MLSAAFSVPFACALVVDFRVFACALVVEFSWFCMRPSLGFLVFLHAATFAAVGHGNEMDQSFPITNY